MRIANRLTTCLAAMCAVIALGGRMAHADITIQSAAVINTGSMALWNDDSGLIDGSLYSFGTQSPTQVSLPYSGAANSGSSADGTPSDTWTMQTLPLSINSATDSIAIQYGGSWTVGSTSDNYEGIYGFANLLQAVDVKFTVTSAETYTFDESENIPPIGGNYNAPVFLMSGPSGNQQVLGAGGDVQVALTPGTDYELVTLGSINGGEGGQGVSTNLGVNQNSYSYSVGATLQPVSVPEPASFSLLALASGAMLMRRRRSETSWQTRPSRG